MNTAKTTEPTWRKSSHSGNEGGACIEVSVAPAAVYVRDSKDRGRSGLTLTPAAWNAFLTLAAHATKTPPSASS